MSLYNVRNSRPVRVMHDLLHESALRSGDKTAIVTDCADYSYSSLLSSSKELASFFKQKGLKKQDRVAIFSENSFEVATAIFASFISGGVFLVINPQTKSDKLEYILKDSGASKVVVEKRYYKEFSSVFESSDLVDTIVVTDVSDEQISGDDVWNFNDIVNVKINSSIDSNLDVHEVTEVIPTDLASIVYTSGSTGNPKGVVMTHQSMLFITGSLNEYIRLSGDDRIINMLPMAFDYGLYQLFMAISLGATLVLEKNFSFPGKAIEVVKAQSVTVFPGVPTIYKTLISMHKKRPISLPGVKRITNTAAALSPETIPVLKEIFPNAKIFKMYGLTECKRVCYLPPELLEKHPASVGQAMPGTETFLLSPEGKPVPAGEVGILHVRGPHVMVGYWKKEKETAHMLKEGLYPGERVLCTHDWFVKDENGLLYFKGRSDDIIKTKGEKVSPIEVENVLDGIDGVVNAAVFGEVDEVMGEKICAYVLKEKNHTINERQVQRECSKRLENFMVPSKVVFVDNLPLTSTGKVSKKLLKERIYGSSIIGH